jgi:hypothetical protein
MNLAMRPRMVQNQSQSQTRIRTRTRTWPGYWARTMVQTPIQTPTQTPTQLPIQTPVLNGPPVIPASKGRVRVLHVTCLKQNAGKRKPQLQKRQTCKVSVHEAPVDRVRLRADLESGSQVPRGVAQKSSGLEQVPRDPDSACMTGTRANLHQQGTGRHFSNIKRSFDRAALNRLLVLAEFSLEILLRQTYWTLCG